MATVLALNFQWHSDILVISHAYLLRLCLLGLCLLFKSSEDLLLQFYCIRYEWWKAVKGLRLSLLLCKSGWHIFHSDQISIFRLWWIRCKLWIFHFQHSCESTSLQINSPYCQLCHPSPYDSALHESYNHYIFTAWDYKDMNANLV